MTHDKTDKLLEIRGLSKAFPGVQALSEVDFDLQFSEVHALVGENGAGKSTLSQIIAGLQTADTGEILYQGRRYRPNGRKDAQAQGIRMVMQELNLIGNLSVAENIYLDRLPNIWGIIDYSGLYKQTGEVMQKVGLGHIHPSTKINQLGVGQQQMVEIAAGLSQSCCLLILDEPTASLTDTEIELLFRQIRQLQEQGVSIIYISHRMDEIMRIADRITVLRDGKVVATHQAGEISISEVINEMVGRNLQEEHFEHAAVRGEIALKVVDLNVGDKVKDVSFEVHRGEILGFAGLMGAGRTETMRAIFGADRADSGKIYLSGSNEPTAIRSPREAVRKGIALLTENRKEQGLFLPLSIRFNISLPRLGDVSRWGHINKTQEQTITTHFAEALSLRYSSLEQNVDKLSGGNQQKVIIAKWLYRNADILIFDEPTRGIDVGAKFEIYHMLTRLAEKGKAIIVVSSDLKELLAICDRIAVMSKGRLAAVFERNNWSEEKINAAAFSEYLNHTNIRKDA